jgi:hypothetical protein
MSIRPITILKRLLPAKSLASALLFRFCHPERSAAMLHSIQGDMREVEGSREYFNLKKRFKAFSKEFPFAVFTIEASSGCFDSRSLAFTLAQYDRVISL